jgi:probable F420-dependent oxidoreductase
MDIGLGLPQSGGLANPDAVRTVATAAERAGFASLWTYDRLLAPVSPRSPYPASADGSLPPEMSTMLDPLLSLAAAAAVTESIRLGTSVLVAPWYSPVMLARSAATLDRLSDGRFTLGLGLGWSIDEFEAVGVPMKGRQLRIEEMLEVMAIVWRDEVVEIETSGEVIAPSTIGLKPVRGHVPLVLAAYTPAGLERIARRADGWNPAGVPLDGVSSMWQHVLQTAARYGRDTSKMRLVVRANVQLTDALGPDRPDFVGSVDQVRDDIKRAAEVGVHDLILELQGVAHSAIELLDVAQTISSDVALAVA